jgi:hypothetical protein
LDIWRVHQDGTDLRRLTATARVEEFPQWSPDGARIVFAALDTGPPFGGRLHTIDAEDGSDDRLLPQLAAPFLEGFDDGRIDSSLWHRISDPGGSIDEVGGRLEASISGTAIPGPPFNQVDQHLGLQCLLHGDYDLQVDWELLAWPPAGGLFAQLSAIYGDMTIARQSTQFGDAIGAWRGGSDFAGNWIASTADRGSFRLQRLGDVTYAYERTTSSGWNLVFGGSGTSGAAVAAVGLWAPAFWFMHQDGSVAFDDFRIKSGEVTCPTWWRDTTPDWAVAG